MRNLQLKRYFLDGMPSYTGDLIPNQIQQAWIRLVACLICTVYMIIHATDLPAHLTTLISIGIAYIALQIYTLLNVKKHPLSLCRTAITPIFDIVFLSTALLVDGGQFSPLYLLYLVTIMGNGMRFGNRLLTYSQILSFIAFPSVCVYLWWVHHTPLDLPVLFMQLLILLILPRYTKQANVHADEAIKAKKDAESMSFQLLDNSPLSAFTFQYDGQHNMCINYVNQTLQHISPLPLEELVGCPIRAMFSSEDICEVEQACLSVLEKEEEHTTFYIRSQGKHSTRQLLGNVRCFDFHDTSVGICFLTDITEQQQETLKMQQNMQDGYMSTLVAGIVHDFRNVLTSIMGTAEMMQFSQTEPKTIEKLALIIQASEQGSRMVTDLLALGKASQSEGHEAEPDIMQALTSMINLLRIQLPESIPLTLHMPNSLPSVQIHLTQLEQLLMNLVKNAAEASPNGGAIDVKLFTGMQHRPSEASTPSMMIQVSDHGMGIAEENLHKVTQAFWTSRKDSGGTGLGLAMVQRIVRQHNGSFHIDSALGKGTCITLTFPMTENILVQTVEKDCDILAVQKNSKIWRVLLVDDNPDVLHVHQHMLERMGHHTTLAHTGKEALSQFTQNPENFDCIVTDFLMPGMDGIDLCQHIRQQNPNIPLLIITAFAENNKLQDTEELNIQMLFKPISFQGFKQQMDMIKV